MKQPPQGNAFCCGECNTQVACDVQTPDRTTTCADSIAGMSAQGSHSRRRARHTARSINPSANHESTHTSISEKPITNRHTRQSQRRKVDHAEMQQSMPAVRALTEMGAERRIWFSSIMMFILVHPSRVSVGNHTTLSEMCSGSEAGSYLMLIDSCITQLKAQGPSRACNESKRAFSVDDEAGRRVVGS